MANKVRYYTINKYFSRQVVGMQCCSVPLLLEEFNFIGLQLLGQYAVFQGNAGVIVLLVHQHFSYIYCY